MPTILQLRRGTTSQNNSFTGSAGELSADTTINTLRLHNGSATGGFELTQNAATQTLTNKTISGSDNTITNIPSSALASSSITVTDGATSTATDLGGTITFSGTTNEIEVSEASGTITIGLPDSVTIGSNLTVTGDLTVSGTTTTINSSTIEVTDSFTFEGSTADNFETVLTITDPTADRTVTIPDATGTVVLQDTADSLENKTLVAPKEKMTIVAGAAAGTITYNASTQSVLYYTNDASSNWTLNVRGQANVTLDSIMAIGESLTIAYLVTQGTTAYYNSAFTIDGSSVTPKWQDGSAPSAGTASGIDVYTYNIIKTASATFTVLASLNDFS
jgi:hypothetical protein